MNVSVSENMVEYIYRFKSETFGVTPRFQNLFTWSNIFISFLKLSLSPDIFLSRRVCFINCWTIRPGVLFHVTAWAPSTLPQPLVRALFGVLASISFRSVGLYLQVRPFPAFKNIILLILEMSWAFCRKMRQQLKIIKPTNKYEWLNLKTKVQIVFR